MTSPEEQLRDRPAVLGASAFERPELASGALRRGRDRLRRRRLLTATAAVGVMVSGAGVITLVGDRRPASTQALQPPDAGSTARPDAAVQIPGRVGPAAPASAFRVAAPLPVPRFGTMLDGDGPPWSAPQVAASAQTRARAGGVDGVVTLQGQACSLPRVGPRRLLDADHHELAVALDGPDQQARLGGNYGVSGAAGEQYGWGFSWAGSWCGRSAAYVTVLLSGTDELTVPLTGPAPSCYGVSDAVLTDGVPGGLDRALLGPPAEWAVLDLALDVAPVATPTEDGMTARGVTLMLRNTSGRPVTLSPCADYSITVTLPGNGLTEGAPGTLPCTSETISAGATVTKHLADVHANTALLTPPEPGQVLTLEAHLAGIGSATASTHVP